MSFSKNLKTITKDQLANQIDLIEKDIHKKYNKNAFFGYYLEYEYCDKPEICKRSIFGMGDADECMFIYELCIPGGNFYWCGCDEPYIVSNQELVEKLWKIIQMDYQ